MRRIETLALKHFLAEGNWKQANTEILTVNGLALYLLHGNAIAKLDKQTNTLTITACGWFTSTTKSRLNSLPKVSICQKQGIWYLNGDEWNGKDFSIKDYI